MKTRLRKIGNSYGVIIPKAMIDDAKWNVGCFLTIEHDAELETTLKLSPPTCEKLKQKNKNRPLNTSLDISRK